MKRFRPFHAPFSQRLSALPRLMLVMAAMLAASGCYTRYRDTSEYKGSMTYLQEGRKNAKTLDEKLMWDMQIMNLERDGGDPAPGEEHLQDTEDFVVRAVIAGLGSPAPPKPKVEAPKVEPPKVDPPKPPKHRSTSPPVHHPAPIHPHPHP